MTLPATQAKIARINARQRQRATRRPYKRPHCEACGEAGHYQNNRRCTSYRERTP